MGGAMMKVGWRPECRWLACRVVDKWPKLTVFIIYIALKINVSYRKL